MIELLSDAPAADPQSSAYLLAAWLADYPQDAVVLAVVDPGVGGDRAALALEADGRWLVGPDNGLLAIVARRARQTRLFEIDWRPERLSATFHGRDLFAPQAARLALGEAPPGHEVALAGRIRSDWPDDLARVIYIDPYGNAMTGIRAQSLPAGARLAAQGREFERAQTFSDLPPGTAFWYENAAGLAEIAVNRGRASEVLGLKVGDPLTLA
ncbi:MAG: SAM hydrolase/SAM-dependent halogenase family protein [Kiloniellales bacterium]